MWRSPLSSIKLLHSTTCFYFAECSLQGTKVKTPHGGLKFNLSVVGDNSVCHHDDPDIIQITFQNSFAFTVCGWAGQGRREGSHTQIPPPCAGISASWQGVYKNWSGTAASQRRRKSMKQLQKLFCPLTAPSAVSVVQGPSPQTHWMYCSQEMQRGSLFLYQLLRNRVTTGTEWRTKKNNFSYARLLRLMASVWGAYR